LGLGNAATLQVRLKAAHDGFDFGKFRHMVNSRIGGEAPR
jgi:hypothetical protein